MSPDQVQAVNWNLMPAELCSRWLDYLNIHDLRRAVLVCRSWHSYVSAINRIRLTALCRRENFPPLPDRRYRLVEAPLYGQISMGRAFSCLNRYENILRVRDNNFQTLLWKKENEEPFIDVRITNEESISEESRYSVKCREESKNQVELLERLSKGSNATWHGTFPYSKFPKGFPVDLPLRLFFKEDGNFKDDNDKLFLIHDFTPVVLTCVHLRQEMFVFPERNRRYTTSFADSIVLRVANSSNSDQKIFSQDQINTLRDNNKALANQWVASAVSEVKIVNADAKNAIP